MLWTIIVILLILWLLGIFWSKYPSSLPKNRQLDSLISRNCNHPPCFEIARDRIKRLNSFPMNKSRG